MKYEKSCGTIIVDNEKILVIQQVKGHWGFPKGHVEAGETEVETAIRETKEETNIDVKVNEKYRFVEKYSPSEGVEKEVVLFLAEKIGGDEKVQQEEVQNIEWLSYEEAMEKVTYVSSKQMLKQAWEIIK